MIPPLNKPRAFSLIELLACVAIIAALAALLFPAYGNAMNKAASAKCLGNLRQIGAAMQLYAGENNGNLPIQNWWTAGATPTAIQAGSNPNGLGFLVPYFGVSSGGLSGASRPKVLQCPTSVGLKLWNQASNWCSYIYQNPFYVPNGSADPSRPQKSCAVKASWALVVDAGQIFGDNVPTHGTSQKGLTSVLYGDGHVEQKAWFSSGGKSVEAWPYKFDLTPGPRN